jgi:23S rRNA pseudouridine955/2504/2580 synthase
LRLPPVRISSRAATAAPRSVPALPATIIFEDDLLLVIDKPAGVAVHGGSGISHGVVEQLRAARPQAPFLELAHRLDRDTSGVLMLAKRRSALLAVHRQLREGAVQKLYLVVVRGHWREPKRSVRLPLDRYVLQSGERRVGVSEEGAPAHTVFRLLRAWRDYSLLEAELKTGRTHQIRVHLAHLGFPVLGDEKYGDFALNKALARQGLKRMVLHAAKAVIEHPRTGEALTLEAPLPEPLQSFIAALDAQETGGQAVRAPVSLREKPHD